MACASEAVWDAHEAEVQGLRGRTTRILPRILLADDQEEMRRTMASMLGDECEILGIAENGQQALEFVLKYSPDVVLLDIFMPVLNGIETATHLKMLGSRTRVLFVTVHEDPDFLETAISVGALGYVLKAHLATDLIPAIRSVMEDHLYISPSMRSL